MSDMIDGSAIEEIKELTEKGLITDMPDGKYCRGTFNKIEPPVHEEETIELTTLDSFVKLIKDNPQKLDFTDAIVTINKDFSVSLLSRPDLIYKRRTEFARAVFPMDLFEFDKFYDQESFMIMIQSRFLFEDQEQEVFRIVSNLVIDNGVQSADNGMAMKLTLKHGISSASNEEVKVRSIVALQPFRIFAECKQVISNFILRLSIGHDGGALAGLWECDGGAWKLDAFQNINSKLVEYGCPLQIYW